MLKDDAALQACLVNDKDHVTPGSRGNHVSKIQKALILLDRSDIARSELQLKTYGPTTAAAVLAYKTKRDIVNRSYQTTADNIVGKMTIARLDLELRAADMMFTPDHRECGGAGGGGGGGRTTTSVPRVSRLSMSFSVADLAPKAQFKARLKVIVQETTAAEELGGSLPLLKQLTLRAQELMAPLGLSFQSTLLDAAGPRVVDGEQVIPGSPASCFSVRAAAEKALPGNKDSLRVIFCPFDDKAQAFGVTDGGIVGGWNFPKFCLINVKKINPDSGTLLHEMIHAALPIRIEHDTDQSSVFAEGKARSMLPAKHAKSLAGSYFAVPG
jgi:hypothetical protein